MGSMRKFAFLPSAAIGFTLDGTTSTIRCVLPGSQADAHGIQVGWTVLGIAGRPTANAKEVKAAMQAVKECGRSFRITFTGSGVVRKAEENTTASDGKHTSEACCAICLEPCSSDGSSTQLKECQHVFHTACIAPWLERKGACPLCRREVDAASMIQCFFRQRRSQQQRAQVRRINIDKIDQLLDQACICEPREKTVSQTTLRCRERRLGMEPLTPQKLDSMRAEFPGAFAARERLRAQGIRVGL